MNKNNLSKAICAQVAVARGWHKETKRNVVRLPDGSKYSFSVTPRGSYPQCRQVYEDTKGFITLTEASGNLYKFEVNDFAEHSLSRISPNNTRAYNIVIQSYNDLVKIA